MPASTSPVTPPPLTTPPVTTPLVTSAPLAAAPVTQAGAAPVTDGINWTFVPGPTAGSNGTDVWGPNGELTLTQVDTAISQAIDAWAKVANIQVPDGLTFTVGLLTSGNMPEGRNGWETMEQGHVISLADGVQYTTTLGARDPKFSLVPELEHAIGKVLGIPEMTAAQITTFTASVMSPVYGGQKGLGSFDVAMAQAMFGPPLTT